MSWALIFIFKLRFPPGVSIATILKKRGPAQTYTSEIQAKNARHEFQFLLFKCMPTAFCYRVKFGFTPTKIAFFN